MSVVSVAESVVTEANLEQVLTSMSAFRIAANQLLTTLNDYRHRQGSIQSLALYVDALEQVLAMHAAMDTLICDQCRKKAAECSGSD